MAKCRAVGITVPIIPGIMPIQNYTGFKRMTGSGPNNTSHSDRTTLHTHTRTSSSAHPCPPVSTLPPVLLCPNAQLLQDGGASAHHRRAGADQERRRQA